MPKKSGELLLIDCVKKPDCSLKAVVYQQTCTIETMQRTIQSLQQQIIMLDKIQSYQIRTNQIIPKTASLAFELEQ